MVLTLLGPPALSEPERRNWFDDPFFQVSSAIADCPVPAGPFITEAERRVQAHHRAERGATCWLAGQCEQSSAYGDDAGIAEAFKSAWPVQGALTHSTLWVTVQGRVVYVEGCVAEPGAEAALESFARGLPKVQQALAIVRSRPDQPVPYRRRAMLSDPTPVRVPP